MKTTFVNMCRFTWDLVVGARRSNCNVAHHPRPSLRGHALMKENADGVYQKFRALNQSFVKAGRDTGTIEDIWVPKYNSKKRKAIVEDDEVTWFPR